jgi:signal transduction histidine kinase
MGLCLAVALVPATLVLVALTSDHVRPLLGTDSHLLDAAFTLAFLAYSVVGAVIVLRQPRNRVGWTLLLSGLGFLLWMFTWRYAAYGLMARPGALPGATLAAWTFEWLIAVGLGPAFAFLPQVSPDGSLPSRRWRPVAWFTTVALTLWAVTWATAPGALSSTPHVQNPVGVAFVGHLDLPGLAWGLTVLAVLASAASLVVRFRRSRGVERRQIRWFAYAAAFMGLTIVAITLSSGGWRPAEIASEVMFPVAVVAVPVAAFLSIFKHDLYDLDVVVSKTITYGILVALITGAYVVVVAALGTAIGVVGQLDLAVAVLVTAAVAVAFHPLRLHVRRLADRLVFGRRATPYEVLATFAQRMGGALDSEDVAPRMARIVGEATGASRAEVWLVIGGDLQRIAAWPPGRGRAVVGLTGDGLPDLPGMTHAVEVRDQGTLLGAIAVAPAPDRPLAPTDHRLLTDVAAQAGLVLRTVGLVEELKASRQRLISAQDEERRRLERDIHDGVQQRLVTLSLSLRMAATRVSDDPPEAVVDAFEAAAREAAETLAELRRLARGIHPAIVSEGGLQAALESLAERAPIRVDVRLNDGGRLPQAVEMTVYYVVAEALTNVAKHASASAAVVDILCAGGDVVAVVCDDGIGGAVAASGSGLQGLRDRVAALGGRLVIESGPEGGTRLRAEIPCGSS